MTIFASDAAAPARLVPGLYFAATRLTRGRDLAYLVLTQWIPSLWLAWRSGLAFGDALGGFAIGMVAFLAAYELGYYANDVWDARRSDDGRRRLATAPGAAYSLLFVAIRLTAWFGIAAWAGWLDDPRFLGGYATLAIVFTLHNWVRAPEPRLASFLALAVLRFLLPVIVLLSAAVLPGAIAAAVLLYAYPRFLSYADSKQLLAMPARRAPAFGLVQMAMLAPLVLVLALWLKAPVLAELLLWFVLVYGGAALLARARSKA